MTIKRLTYIMVALAGMSLASCEDYLDTVPDNRVDLTTTDHVQKLLNAAYPAYHYAWPCEIWSDNIEDNNAPDDNGMRYNLNAYNKGDDEMFAWESCVSSSDADTPTGIWEGFYGSIAHCNAALERLDEMEKEQGRLDDTQRALKGEALVLRSYCHFILANVFCLPYRGPELSKELEGIPYSVKPETTVKPHYERGTLAETYDKIRKDLEEGLPLVSNTIYTIPKYHFNVAAANAYAARFYLFCREYDKVLEHANAAFGGPDVDATQFMSKIYTYADAYYISDFGRYNMSIDKPNNFLLLASHSQAWRHYVGGLRYHVIRHAQEGTMKGPGPTWQRQKFVSGKKGADFYMNACFAHGLGTNGQTEYGVYFPGNICEQFEYTDKVAGIGYTHVTHAEFTGDQLLLERAEAKLFLGDVAGCMADLVTWDKHRQTNVYCSTNKGVTYLDFTPQLLEDFYKGISNDGNAISMEIVRPINIDRVHPSKYTLDDAKEPYLQCIQHFRRIETVHTGRRWFDIRRLGIEFKRKIYDRDLRDTKVDSLMIGDIRRAIPIPSEVVAAGLAPTVKAPADLKVSDTPAIKHVNTAVSHK